MSRQRVFYLISLLVFPAITVGCSSGSPRVAPGNGSWPAGVTLPDPPTDVPDPVRGQLVSLAKDVATAFCNHAGPCCVSLNTTLSKECVTFASVVWANANVAKVHNPPDANFEYAFDESRAAACRDHLAQLDSGCGFEWVRSNPRDIPAMSLVQSFCMAALSVTVSGQTWQCQSDTDCIAYSEGLACADGHCVDVGSCQGSDADAGAGACLAELAVNDACSTSSGPSCAPGLVCNGNVCAPLSSDGEPCANASSCDDNLRCVPSSESDPYGAGLCQALGPRGQLPCTQSWQCNHECVSGFCDPREDTFCMSPY